MPLSLKESKFEDRDNFLFFMHLYYCGGAKLYI